MFTAINQLKERVLTTVDSLVEKAEEKIQSAGSSATSSANKDSKIWKDMLVEYQINQIKISREYQKQFEEKELQISSLQERIDQLSGKVAASKDTTAAVSTSSYLSDANQENSSFFIVTNVDGKDNGVEGENNSAEAAVASASGDPKKKKLTEDELRKILKDFESKMRENIMEKTEAQGDARIYAEQVQVLKAESDMLKDSLKDMEGQLAILRSMQTTYENNMQEMDQLVLECSALSAEVDVLRAKMSTLTLENDALSTKPATNEKTLKLLSSGGKLASKDSEISHEKESELNAEIAQLRDEIQKLKKTREALLQKAKKEWSEKEMQQSNEINELKVLLVYFSISISMLIAAIIYQRITIART